MKMMKQSLLAAALACVAGSALAGLSQAEVERLGKDLTPVGAEKEGNKAVVVSAKIESEIAVLPPADQKDYLDAVGLHEPGLNRVIREGYALLGLLIIFGVSSTVPVPASASASASGTGSVSSDIKNPAASATGSKTASTKKAERTSR